MKLNQEQKDLLIGVIEHEITTPLTCPNCKLDMTLEKIRLNQDGRIYDQWGCDDCAHIIVLDERFNE